MMRDYELSVLVYVPNLDRENKTSTKLFTRITVLDNQYIKLFSENFKRENLKFNFQIFNVVFEWFGLRTFEASTYLAIRLNFILP